MSASDFYFARHDECMKRAGMEPKSWRRRAWEELAEFWVRVAWREDADVASMEFQWPLDQSPP